MLFSFRSSAYPPLTLLSKLGQLFLSASHRLTAERKERGIWGRESKLAWDGEKVEDGGRPDKRGGEKK